MMSAETEVLSSDCQPSHVRAAGIPYAPCSARDARTTLRRPGTSYAYGALRVLSPSGACIPHQGNGLHYPSAPERRVERTYGLTASRINRDACPCIDEA